MRPQKVVVRSVIQKRKSAKGNRWVVRWTVDGKEFSRSSGTAAPAQDLQLELRSAVKRAEKFDAVTGEPISWKANATFLDASLDFVKRKYGNWAPATRSSNIRALAIVVVAAATPPLSDELREVARALFIEKCIPARDITLTQQQQVSWQALQRNSWPLSEITARRCEDVLDLMGKRNGWNSTDRAAPASFTRRRTLLSGVLNAAVADESIPASPLQRVLRTPTKLQHAVVKSEIPTVQQGLLLIDEIREARSQLDTAKRLAVFFAVTLYCGLRPGEVSGLRPQDIMLPGPDDNGWGTLTATASVTQVIKRWTDDGKTVTHGPLKQRADSTTRLVPAPPALMKILAEFAAECEPSSDGYLIRTRAGRPIGGTICAPLKRAKKKLGWVDAHPLSGVTHYTLRHTNASTLLEAGLSIAEVAKRLGHSELELLRTYTNVFHASTTASNAKLDNVF